MPRAVAVSGERGIDRGGDGLTGWVSNNSQTPNTTVVVGAAEPFTRVCSSTGSLSPIISSNIASTTSWYWSGSRSIASAGINWALNESSWSDWSMSTTDATSSTDPAAVTTAPPRECHDQVGSHDPRSAEHRRNVAGHRSEIVRGSGGRLAVASQVERDHLVGRAESIDDRSERGRRFGDAMNEHHGVTGADTTPSDRGSVGRGSGVLMAHVRSVAAAIVLRVRRR